MQIHDYNVFYLDIINFISVSCEEHGYVSVQSTKKCLKIYASPTRTWMDANSTCGSAGGKLFSITSATMFNDVLNAIAQEGNSEACFFLFLCVCVRVYCFTSRSRIFHLYGDVIAGEGLQNLGLCSSLRACEQGGIFIVPHLL
jgi:hypothetical protein